MTATSQFILAFGFLGYLFVYTTPLLFLMALLTTSGTRMFFAASATLIVDIAVSHELDRWYGLVGAIRNGGLGLGSLLAGLALTMNDLHIYRLFIGICFSCYLLAGILLFFLPVHRERHIILKEKVSYKVILQNHLFLLFLVSNIAFPLCALLLGTAFPLYVTQAVQAPAWIVAPLLVLNSLLIIICQTPIVRLLEPYRRTRAIACAALVWCGACILVALSLILPQSILVPYLFFAITIYTLASLFYGPAVSSFVANLGPTALRGRYLATYEFTWGIASALAPAFFTTLYSANPALPWSVLAAIVAVSGITILLLERRFPVQAVRKGVEVVQKDGDLEVG